MSRGQNHPSVPITTPLMKVNELVNSIYAINQGQLIEQLQTCSKIVSQLLQNQLIQHITSLGAAKLLCYQLVLLIAEENAVEARPRLSLLQNAFGNNKKIKLTASLRNNLYSISELLEEMVWKNIPKKRGGAQKAIVENSPFYQGYVEFKHLLNDFDRHLEEENDQVLSEVTDRKKICDESGQDENQALIEQLQQIVAKKQKRIKQLNEQLQQTILQQKAQQDLISQLQCRNIDLKQQINMLSQKLSNKDIKQIQLLQKIQDLKAQMLNSQKQQNFRKQMAKTQKTIKTKFTIDDEQESTVKKQYRDLFEEKEKFRDHVCVECEGRKDAMEDGNNFRRMLLMQAVSIEALI